MKKMARQQAESIFLEAHGKMSNVDIAKSVGVNPLTVGKWKKEDGWAAKLTEKSAKIEKKAAPRPARKKGAHDQALKLYLESGGKIANTVLASKTAVSPASIANWKASERWSEKLTEPKEPAPPEPVMVEKPVQVAQAPEAEKADEIEIDLDELTCPDHINQLNKRIEEMLSREYLSPSDLKTLAEAKEAVLAVVSAYIDIIERVSED